MAPKPAPSVVSPPAAPRKSAFSKEAIPFQWKIVGKSGGLNVVLSKHVEQESAEKELVRLTETGMYQNLVLMPIGAAVTQSREAMKKVKAAIAARAEKAAAASRPKVSKGFRREKAKAKPKPQPAKPKPRPQPKADAKPENKGKGKSKARPKAKARKK
jgi:hypothetical protein